MNFRTKMLRFARVPDEGDKGGGGDSNAWKVSLAGGNQDRAKVLEGFESQDKLFERLTTAPAAPDWRKVVAGESADDLKALERFTDPGMFVKSWKDSQEAIRGNGRIKIPGADAKPEEIAEFNKALGVPEKVDGYKIEAKPPEGYEPQESDTQFLTGLTERLHKAGAPPNLVNEAHQIYWDEATKAVVAGEERAADSAIDSERFLKGKWGSNYDANLAWADAGFSQFFPGTAEERDAFLGMTLPSGHRVGDHPLMLQMMAQIGLQNAEDPFFGKARADNKGFDPDKRIQEIQKLRNGTSAERDEYRKLSMPGGELAKLIDGNERRKAQGAAR